MPAKKHRLALFVKDNMHLGNELAAMGHNILGDFTCKWRTVEDALFKAIGDEQNVTRLANFLSLNYTKFVDQPFNEWEELGVCALPEGFAIDIFSCRSNRGFLY